jgi:hypothetical protein
MRHQYLTVAALLVVGTMAATAQHADHHTSASTRTTTTTSSTTTQTKIRQAMRAAPPEISRKAAIMDWPEKEGMPMKHLRAGTNGWTCMPSTPVEVTSPLQEDPMCVDKSFTALLDAYAMKAEPKVTSVGIGYMLRGDRGASNTDPFAMAPTADNHWVVSGPHIMVVVPNPQQIDAYPTDPQAGGPWVMWKGTKYAHLMIPVASMPKTSASQ